MYPIRTSVSVTTIADGSATTYSDQLRGQLAQIRYVKTDFADGVDFTITNETTGETIWTELNVNADATRSMLQATHSTSGVASLYAAGGAAVNGPIMLCGDRVKIIIASGGNAKTGAFQIITY